MIKIFTSKTQIFGEKGEEEAVVFLMKHGFKILNRNVTNKFGEIDIVAQKDNTTYFFEVKAGNLDAGIHPSENLHPTKIKKFLRSVEYYSFCNKIISYRIQGIIVLFREDKKPNIEIIDIF